MTGPTNLRIGRPQSSILRSPGSSDKHHPRNWTQPDDAFTRNPTRRCRRRAGTDPSREREPARRPARGCPRSPGRRRSAGTANRTRGIRARRRRSRDRHRCRRRSGGTGLPLPRGRALCRRSRVPVGGQPLERIPVHVDLREAAGDQLIAEVLPAGEPDVGEEASVAIACVLGRVTAEDDLLRHRELACACGGLGEVADTSFGRVDPDQPDPLSSCRSSAGRPACLRPRRA